MLEDVNGKCTNGLSCSAFNLLREGSLILISLRGGEGILLMFNEVNSAYK